MSTLAQGQSVTITVGDDGTIRVATNGGFATASITPVVGSAHSINFGPLPSRRILGPYKEGASVVLLNQTASSMDYDSSSFGSSGGGAPGVAGQVDSYLGQGATRARVPNTNTTANKQGQSRTFHVWNGDPTTSIQVEYPNWYVAGGTFPETGNVVAASIASAIEFPQTGQIIPFTYSGAAVGSIPSGLGLFCDPVTVPLMRKGTPFYLRPWFASTNGLVYYSDSNTSISGLPGPCDERYTIGATTPNLSAGGNIANTVGSTGLLNYFPTKIVSTTTRRSFMWLSNSRGAGSFDTMEKDGNIGDLARSIGKDYGYISNGVPSDQLQFIAVAIRSVNRIAAAAYVTDVIIGDFINDTRSGRTSAQVLTDINTIIALLLAVNPTVRIWLQTSSPYATSPNGFIDSANQTVQAGEANRVLVNNAARTNVIANVSGCIDITAQVETFKDSGKWLFNPDTTNYYCESNGLHSAYAGYQRIAASGIVNRALGI